MFGLSLKEHYILRRFYEDVLKEHPEKEQVRDYLVDVKREIRRLLRLQREEGVVVRDGGDSYTVKVKAPEWCRSKDDVEEWFKEHEYLPIVWSQYDCTGQLFTNWYHVALLHGEWYVYHDIGMDV